MRLRVGSGHWVAVSRIALVGLIGSAAAACSTDTVRFAENRSPIRSPPASGWTRARRPRPAPASPSYSAAPMPTAFGPGAGPAARAVPAPVAADPHRFRSRPRSSRAPCRSAQTAAQPPPAEVPPRRHLEGAGRHDPRRSRRARKARPSRHDLDAGPGRPLPPKSAPMQVASATNEPLGVRSRSPSSRPRSRSSSSPRWPLSPSLSP